MISLITYFSLREIEQIENQCHEFDWKQLQIPLLTCATLNAQLYQESEIWSRALILWLRVTSDDSTMRSYLSITLRRCQGLLQCTRSSYERKTQCRRNESLSKNICRSVKNDPQRPTHSHFYKNRKFQTKFCFYGCGSLAITLQCGRICP